MAVAVAVSCLLILTVCQISQAHFNKHIALFVFGDSLYDPGNNNYINTTPEFQANFFPYGESYFNPPSGRFSDGRLIPDFVGENIYKQPPISFSSSFLTHLLSNS